MRIEVTINNPKDFKILKRKKDEETGEVTEAKKWTPIGKSIANLYRYVEISKSIIGRYMNALPDIDEDKLPLKAIKSISSRKNINGRPYSAFNILNDDTLKLFVALSDGAFLINGLSNKLLRRKVFDDFDSKRSVNKTTRLISKLKAHGVVKKVPKKNRYYLTVNGRKIINSILLYTNKVFAEHCIRSICLIYALFTDW